MSAKLYYSFNQNTMAFPGFTDQVLKRVQKVITPALIFQSFYLTLSFSHLVLPL